MRQKVIIFFIIILLLATFVLIFEVNRIRDENDTQFVSETEALEDTQKERVEPSNGKTIFLTFDDGPYMYTEKLLEILDEYDVKATFFVTAQNEDFINLIEKECLSGHSVGMHTYSHKYKEIYKSDSQLLEDFHKIQNLIKDQTGSFSRIYRFPGGSSNTVSTHYNKGIVTRMVEYLDAQGYEYYDWNVISGDSEGLDSPEKILNHVIEQINEQDEVNYIVLQHDIYECSVDATGLIIEWGLENGYKFDKITKDTPTVHFEVVN